MRGRGGQGGEEGYGKRHTLPLEWLWICGPKVRRAQGHGRAGERAGGRGREHGQAGERSIDHSRTYQAVEGKISPLEKLSGFSNTTRHTCHY